MGIALDAAGRILVADRDSGPGGQGAVIAVDPATGAQTIISQAGNFATPVFIAVVPQRVAVPEPASLLLFAVGLGGVAVWGWRRRRRPAVFIDGYE